MKIIHFADLHLGIESYGVLNPQTGLSARLEDFLSAFDKLVEYAVSEGVELVLFCGDAYQRKDPTQTYQREFAGRLMKLSRAGIPVVLVPGNHDLHPSPNKASSVDIFSVLTAPNGNAAATHVRGEGTEETSQAPVYTSRRPQVFNIPTRNGKVQVLSVPWLWRSSLTAKEEYKALSYDSLNQEMSGIVTELVGRESQSISSDSPAILASHLWVTGSKLGSEQSYTLERDYSLLPSSLALSAFDYVALGHIHSRQSFALDPPVVYAGSLERIDFSDEGIPKGFYLVEIDESKPRERRKTQYKFIELPARKFISIDMKAAADDANPQASLMQEMARRQEEVKDAIVRLNIQWPHPHQLRPADQEIRKSLSGAFLVAIIKWDMTQSAGGRLRLAGDPCTLSPLDALGEYLKVRQTSSQEAAELRSYAEKLLREIEQPT